MDNKNTSGFNSSSKPMTGESELKQSATKEMATPAFKPEDVLHLTNVDERYVYRWLNAKKFNEYGGHDPRGWEVVTTLNQGGTPKNSPGYINDVGVLDGTIRRGDLILAKMPKDNAKQRRVYFDRKRKQREEIMSVKSRLSGTKSEVRFEQRKGNDVQIEN